MRAWALTTALVLVGLPSTRAWAQTACQPPDGLSTCVPSDNLWPYAGDGPWQSLAPTSTAAPSGVNTGVTLSYSYRPIGLTIGSPDPEGTTIYVVEHVLWGNFVSAVGITDRLQLQFAAPVALYQEGASTGDVLGANRTLPRSAVGDLRFGLSLRALKRAPGANGVAITPRLEMSAPSGSDDALTGSASAAFAPGVASDLRYGRWRFGLDLGARIREDSRLAGAIIGSQISAALGVSVAAIDDGWLRIGLEGFALVGLLEQLEPITEPGDLTPDLVPTGRPHVPAEWLLSVRHERLVGGQLHLGLAGGGTIPTGPSAVTAPALRMMTSMQLLWDDVL